LNAAGLSTSTAQDNQVSDERTSLLEEKREEGIGETVVELLGREARKVGLNLRDGGVL
jgi:erythromycin esterase-like protein